MVDKLGGFFDHLSLNLPTMHSRVNYNFFLCHIEAECYAPVILSIFTVASCVGQDDEVL